MNALEQAKSALSDMPAQFTRTPSTLADSEARGKAHEAIAAIDATLASPLTQAAPSTVVPELAFDFHSHLARQAAWSEKTFGPGMRTAGVCDHIRKELTEIEADPSDLAEWIDVVILGLDGAWRCGGTPSQIINGIVAKQTKNEGRIWPDWRTADPNKAIEHDRTADLAAAPAQPVLAAEQKAQSDARDVIPELRNIESTQMQGDFAVLVQLMSCRSACAFKAEIDAAIAQKAVNAAQKGNQ